MKCIYVCCLTLKWALMTKNSRGNVSEAFNFSTWYVKLFICPLRIAHKQLKDETKQLNLKDLHDLTLDHLFIICIVNSMDATSCTNHKRKWSITWSAHRDRHPKTKMFILDKSLAILGVSWFTFVLRLGAYSLLLDISHTTGNITYR